MTRESLNQKIAESGLTKREFAKLLGLSYTTVNNWGSSGKGIPFWVGSWLDNYRKAAILEQINSLLRNGSHVTNTIPP